MPSNTDYLLAIEDLTVSFDGFKAVDELTLYVDKGELRVIIGPNGAGKTTVLDLISGKTRASSGSIRYNNVELTSIYEKLSVYENLEISYPWGRTVFGSLKFTRTKQVIDRIQDVAQQIFLSDMLETQAELLSHGQKQWLEIGMLLVQNPELIMLDEPVAGMTAKEREATAALLEKIAKERSIIIIEHDMDFVAKIADQVTVLHLGKILKQGSMDQVRDDPVVQEVYLGH